MTVYELLHKTSKEDIIKRFKSRFSKEIIGELEVLLNQIWELTPVNNDDWIVNEVYDDVKTKGLFEYREIYAFNKKEPNEHVEIYTIPLQKVLGFSIEESCLKAIEPEDLITDILDEI